MFLTHTVDTVILVTKSAISAVPRAQMEKLSSEVQARLAPGSRVAFAFSEQGSPDLRSVLLEAVGNGARSVVIVPLLVPMEPGFRAWLAKALVQWRHQYDGSGNWPEIFIGGTTEQTGMMAAVVEAQIAGSTALAAEELDPSKGRGSLVPQQKYRVLICNGAPCNNAGSSALWRHFRAEQDRQKLRTAGEGVMSARTSCMGPCNLAPVMQVFPDGTWYGGVTEAAIDRIIADHLLGGVPVADLEYEPDGTRKYLRSGPPPS